MAPRSADWYALPHIRCEPSLILRISAVPHRLVTDDVYEGYFLPAGSMVIGNAW